MKAFILEDRKGFHVQLLAEDLMDAALMTRMSINYIGTAKPFGYVHKEGQFITCIDFKRRINCVESIVKKD